jgi:2-phosphosulfolactate phosphatase
MICRRSALDTCSEATDTVVVIDVLRAFSTAASALAAGAESITIVGTVEEALALKRQLPDALLMGEIDGLPIKGFDFGNSPAPFTKMSLKGRRMVQRTTRGTQGVIRCGRAHHLLATGFCNAGATAEHIGRLGSETVTFVPTGLGTIKNQGDEDVACAEYIEALLHGERPDVEPFLQRVSASPAGRKFTDPGQPDFPVEDLERCLEVDRFDFAMVAQRKEGLIILNGVKC